jgi:hypothetical protein
LTSTLIELSSQSMNISEYEYSVFVLQVIDFQEIFWFPGTMLKSMELIIRLSFFWGISSTSSLNFAQMSFSCLLHGYDLRSFVDYLGKVSYFMGLFCREDLIICMKKYLTSRRLT